MLFLARAIDGITGGNISVANAYLSDISSDENRSKNFGKMAISSNLGFIVGPAIAGILGCELSMERSLPVHSCVTPVRGYVICIMFSVKRIRALVRNEILVPEEGTIRKVFAHRSVERSLFQTAEHHKARVSQMFSS